MVDVCGSGEIHPIYLLDRVELKHGINFTPCCLCFCLHHILATLLSPSPLTVCQSAHFNNPSHYRSALKGVSIATRSISTRTHIRSVQRSADPIETSLCRVSLSVVSCPLTSVLHTVHVCTVLRCICVCIYVLFSFCCFAGIKKMCAVVHLLLLVS